ncbi:secreted ookinete protein, putative [Plasmodium relictum]|uniref:Secreted ookinete protein, putative n=1 Tax=Plasmodium relictum TaxID=85471 RepID=A0A1J1HB16_PLARL|nr:secreted ookinete protein, putative [Plasmodium relictum]CRH01689.1 secreted ookinete protein, putative [Plasmodium relictum]
MNIKKYCFSIFAYALLLEVLCELGLDEVKKHFTYGLNIYNKNEKLKKYILSYPNERINHVDLKNRLASILKPNKLNNPINLGFSKKEKYPDSKYFSVNTTLNDKNDNVYSKKTKNFDRTKDMHDDIKNKSKISGNKMHILNKNNHYKYRSITDNNDITKSDANKENMYGKSLLVTYFDPNNYRNNILDSDDDTIPNNDNDNILDNSVDSLGSDTIDNSLDNDDNTLGNVVDDLFSDIVVDNSLGNDEDNLFQKDDHTILDNTIDDQDEDTDDSYLISDDNYSAKRNDDEDNTLNEDSDELLDNVVDDLASDAFDNSLSNDEDNLFQKDDHTILDNTIDDQDEDTDDSYLISDDNYSAKKNDDEDNALQEDSDNILDRDVDDLSNDSFNMPIINGEDHKLYNVFDYLDNNSIDSIVSIKDESMLNNEDDLLNNDYGTQVNSDINDISNKYYDIGNSDDIDTSNERYDNTISHRNETTTDYSDKFTPIDRNSFNFDNNEKLNIIKIGISTIDTNVGYLNGGEDIDIPNETINNDKKIKIKNVFNPKSKINDISSLNNKNYNISTKNKKKMRNISLKGNNNRNGEEVYQRLKEKKKLNVLNEKKNDVSNYMRNKKIKYYKYSTLKGDENDITTENRFLREPKNLKVPEASISIELPKEFRLKNKPKVLSGSSEENKGEIGFLETRTENINDDVNSEQNDGNDENISTSNENSNESFNEDSDENSSDTENDNYNENDLIIEKMKEDKNLDSFSDENVENISTSENSLIRKKKNIIKNSRKVYNLNLYNCSFIDDWDLNHEYVDEEGKLVKLSGYVFQNIVNSDSMPTTNITDWKLKGSCDYDKYVCGALNYMNNLYSKGERVIYEGKIYEATSDAYESPKDKENIWVDKTSDCYNF